jgi:flagellar motor switch protein FliN
MPSDQAMDVLTATGQALASVPLPPTMRKLPRGARTLRWEELDDSQAATRAGGKAPGHDVIDLRIELGRTRICADELRKLRIGSVVALDNPAGDAVDLYAGGQLIARGEVVEVNGHFGVRVIELVRS